MIVVLNGASSAGKTSLARAVQDEWAEPALIWGIDTVVTALHRAVAALGRAGVNVLVDQVILTPGWGADLRAACAGLDLLAVHVYCPPAELRLLARGKFL